MGLVDAPIRNHRARSFAAGAVAGAAVAAVPALVVWWRVLARVRARIG